MVSHNLQQRGAAETGDVKFAVEQRMGSAVMLLQEVRNWPGAKACCLATNFTQTLSWTLLLPYRGILRVTFVKKVLSKKYTFVVLFGTVWGSVHLPCHGDVSQNDLWSMLKEMENVVINLRRRHHTSRVVIGSDLNVSLAPVLKV